MALVRLALFPKLTSAPHSSSVLTMSGRDMEQARMRGDIPLASGSGDDLKDGTPVSPVKMRISSGGLLLPLIYSNLVIIYLPIMYCQLMIACHGETNGLSSLQIAILFCNAPVLLSFLGACCKQEAEGRDMGRLLCLSTASLAAATALLALVPLRADFLFFLIWMLLLTLISTACFFSQLASFAVISKNSVSLPPSILIIDLCHAASAAIGMVVCYYCNDMLGSAGLLLLTSALLIFPPLVLWLMCVNDSPVPSLFIKDAEEAYSCDKSAVQAYFNDERLKNDLVKDNPYLMMENDGFAKNLIDTDAQVIILMNIIYVVTVSVGQGVNCFSLVTLAQRSEQFTLEKCCFLYAMGVILSTAVCSISRPFILHHNICNKVISILYLALTNILSLFLMSDIDAYVGKYILSYCAIVSNCQLLEEIIDSVITSYYDSILLPAMKSFSVRDYINEKVGFLHGAASVTGPLLFGLIATDIEIESLLFTVAAVFTTLTVVTTPLSLLFVAADLR